MHRLLVGIIFIVVILVFLILQEKVQSRHNELLEWLMRNAHSGPLIVMLVALLESIFFLPVEYLTLGTGYVLHEKLGHELKAVVMCSIAIWTGAWIGSSLNSKILKFLLRDRIKILMSKFHLTQSVDEAVEKHGLKIVLFLRLSPFLVVNLIT